MKLSEMTDHERETLGTLIRLMVGADGATSREESSDLQKIAVELGEADFWALVRKTHGEVYSQDAVQAQAQTIERKAVQQQLYNVLFSIATEGSIMGSEGQLLSWLGETWGIDTGAPPRCRTGALRQLTASEHQGGCETVRLRRHGRRTPTSSAPL